MFSIDIERVQAEKDFVIAELWEAGSTGIVELEDRDDIARMRAFFDDDSRQAALIAQFGGEAAACGCARLGVVRARKPEADEYWEADFRDPGMV